MNKNFVIKKKRIFKPFLQVYNTNKKCGFIKNVSKKVIPFL